MRRTFLMGLGLAASLASVAAAQQPGADKPRRDGKEDHRGNGARGEGRFGGPRGLLFKDITLTEAQKSQIKELRKSEHDKMDASRDQMRKQFEEARAARERGDTAAVRAIRERNRQAMDQQRAQQVAAIRNILTSEQRVQFDKNVAALKEHEAQRGERGRGKRGDRAERGFRGRLG